MGIRMILSLLCSVLLTAVLCPQLLAQGKNIDNKSLSQDNWELWRKGFEAFEAGEMAYLNRRYDSALELFHQSLDCFLAVRKENPNWNKSVIEYRISLSNKKIASTKQRLAEDVKNAKESVKVPVKNGQSAEAVKNAEIEAWAAELASTKSALAVMTKENAELKQDIQRGKLALDQVKILLNEKDELDKKYTALELQYKEVKEQQKKAFANSETEKALAAEQARNEALAKTLKEANEELLSQGKQNRELAAAKVQAENVLKTLKERLTLLEPELKNVAADVEKVRKQELASSEKIKVLETEKTVLNKTVAEKVRAADELTEQVRKLRAGLELSDATKKIEAEATAIRAENEILKVEAAKLIAASEKDKKEARDAQENEIRAKAFLKALNDKNEELASTVKELTKTVAEKEKLLAEQIKLFAIASEDLKKTKTELESFAKKINETDRKDTAFSTDLLNAKKALVESELQTRKLQEEKSALTKDNVALKERLDISLKANETEIAKLAGILKNKDAELAKLTDLLKSKESELAKFSDGLKMKTAELAKLSATVKSQGDTVSEIKLKDAELANLSEVLKAKDAELANLSEVLKAKDVDLQKYVKNISALKESEQESAKIVEALKKRDAELAKLSDLLKAKEDELGKVSALLKTSAAELEKWKDAAKELQTLRTANDTLEKNNKELKAGLETARKSAGDYAKSEIEKLTAKQTELQETNTQLNSAVKKLSDVQTTLTEEKTKALAEIRELKNTLDKAVRAEAENARIKALEVQLLKEKESSASFEKLYKSKQEEAENLAERRLTLDKDITAIKQELKASRERETKLDADLKKWMSGAEDVVAERLAAKDAALNELLTEHESMKKEMKTLQTRLEESNLSIIRYKKRISLAAEAANSAVSEARRLKAELRAYRKAGDIPRAQPQQTSPAKLAEEKNEVVKSALFKEDEVSEIKADLVKYEKSMKAAKDAESAGNYEDALWQYWIAADAGVNRYEPYLGLTRLQLREKDREAAEKSYEKALKFGAPRDSAIEEALKK